MSDDFATRVSYTLGELTEEELAAVPLEQFRRWYGEVARVAGQFVEPNTMVLATVDASGPSLRTLLLKQADARGFVFYTNYGSRKARQIGDGGGRVSLLFPWYQLQRQVGVVGVAERVPAEESRAYFGTRPWASRIGAWTSEQSRTIEDRHELARRFDELARRWPDHGSPDDVPMPEHWGGYVVRASEVEFWQGRPSRLHDRLVYVAPAGPADLDDEDAWRVERRQP